MTSFHQLEESQEWHKLRKYYKNSGIVYIAHAPLWDKNLFKVGMASKPKIRLNSYKSHYPPGKSPEFLIYWISKDIVSLENHIHTHLLAHGLREPESEEWYRGTLEQLKENINAIIVHDHVASDWSGLDCYSLKPHVCKLSKNLSCFAINVNQVIKESTNEDWLGPVMDESVTCTLVFLQPDPNKWAKCLVSSDLESAKKPKKGRPTKWIKQTTTAEVLPRGVCKDTNGQGYRAQYCKGGVTRQFLFKINVYGAEEAKNQAIKKRKELEEEYGAIQSCKNKRRRLTKSAIDQETISSPPPQFLNPIYGIRWIPSITAYCVSQKGERKVFYCKKLSTQDDMVVEPWYTALKEAIEHFMARKNGSKNEKLHRLMTELQSWSKSSSKCSSSSSSSSISLPTAAFASSGSSSC